MLIAKLPFLALCLKQRYPAARQPEVSERDGCYWPVLQIMEIAVDLIISNILVANVAML